MAILFVSWSLRFSLMVAYPPLVLHHLAVMSFHELDHARKVPLCPDFFVIYVPIMLHYLHFWGSYADRHMCDNGITLCEW